MEYCRYTLLPEAGATVPLLLANARGVPWVAWRPGTAGLSGGCCAKRLVVVAVPGGFSAKRLVEAVV